MRHDQRAHPEAGHVIDGHNALGTLGPAVQGTAVRGIGATWASITTIEGVSTRPSALCNTVSARAQVPLRNERHYVGDLRSPAAWRPT